MKHNTDSSLLAELPGLFPFGSSSGDGTTSAVYTQAAFVPLLLCFLMAGCGIVAMYSTVYVRSETGLPVAVSMLLPVPMYACFVLSGRISSCVRRIGVRTVALSGLSAMLCGMLVMLFSHSVAALAVSVALLGVGAAVVLLSAERLFAGLGAMVRPASLRYACLMAMAVPVIGGAFLAAFSYSVWGGWRYSLVPMAVLCVLTAASLFFFRGSVAEQSADSPAHPTDTVAGGATSVRRRCGLGCVRGADAVMAVTVPVLLGVRCGLSEADAALAVSVYFSFYTLGFISCGTLRALLRGRWCMALTLSVALAAVGILLFAGGEYVILVASGVVGMCSPVMAEMLKRQTASTASASFHGELVGGALTLCLSALCVWLSGTPCAALVVVAVALCVAAFTVFTNKRSI